MPTVEAIPLDLGRMLGAVFGVAIIAGLLGPSIPPRRSRGALATCL
jgi:hypothetical protein